MHMKRLSLSLNSDFNVFATASSRYRVAILMVSLRLRPSNRLTREGSFVSILLCLSSRRIHSSASLDSVIPSFPASAKHASAACIACTWLIRPPFNAEEWSIPCCIKHMPVAIGSLTISLSNIFLASSALLLSIRYEVSNRFAMGASARAGMSTSTSCLFSSKMRKRTLYKRSLSSALSASLSASLINPILRSTGTRFALLVSLLKSSFATIFLRNSAAFIATSANDTEVEFALFVFPPSAAAYTSRLAMMSCAHFSSSR
mmetsp:Transcript_43622/g.113662  ORF Transcript_43622/g.113662 Transcript_43622/m.113662 type:complete len:260 (+) Transcript_43622:461-1240(+)